MAIVRTRADLLNLLASCAGDYHKKVIPEIKHIITDNNVKIDKPILQIISNAVIVGFINFVGEAMGVDYGMRVKYLPEELKKNKKRNEEIRKEEARLQVLSGGEPIMAACPACYQRASTLNPIFRDRVHRLELVVFVCHDCKLIYVDRKINKKIIKKWNEQCLYREPLKVLYGDYLKRLNLFVRSYIKENRGYKKRVFS
jgi:hypothetical protein